MIWLLMVKTQNMYSFFMGIILRHPLGVILAAIVEVVLSLSLTATRLGFQTGHLDLIYAGERYKQLQQAYHREFEELSEGWSSSSGAGVQSGPRPLQLP
jgi:hypothetical protein